MPKQIIISYSSEDREYAEDICGLLEKHGIDCWIAPRDIKPGKNYGEEIINAIESCYAMVLVLSEHANRSIHVKNEVERAVSKGKTVFPIRIRAVQPSRALELFIAASQWIDAFAPPLEARVEQLAAAINELLKLRKDIDFYKGEKEGEADEKKVSMEQPVSELQIVETTRTKIPPQYVSPPPDMNRFTTIPGRQIETGSSIIVSVIDRETGKMCLLKRIAKERVNQPITNIAHMRVDGSNIASPILQWEDDDMYYELLPMVNGWTLAEIMSLNPGIFGEYLTNWCRALLEIVKTLQEHKPPLIHRDIKPSNVMVRNDNLSSLVLIDCTAMISCPAPDGLIPQGTAGYSPPEAMAGSPNLASDLYSVGCTIYSLNRKEPPPSPTQIEHFGAAMSLTWAEHEVGTIFKKLVDLDYRKRFPDALSAVAAMKKPEYTQHYKTFADLTLPDGRGLKQGGWY